MTASRLQRTAVSATILMAAFFAAYATQLNLARADVIVETPTTTDSLEFTIKNDVINSWSGSYRLPAATAISRTPRTATELLASTILGREVRSENKSIPYSYDPVKVHEWVQSIAPLFPNDTAEPELQIENKRAVKFTPPKVGQRLDTYQSTINILEALQKKEARVTVATTEVQPKTPLSTLNDLGINELIGHGESKFNGSPKNRRHNIRVGVQKETGIIIAPGEEFSFNKYLGPVEANTGFLPELVIKQTGTVPEFGGGLCQVSSTTFRAAMDAGLPITARRNHSYAVQYYAPQGTDATIYPGVQDLKFINDTKGHILIWPYFKDDNTLVFDIYGTKDDRKIIIEKPVSYDRKSSGAMKAYWDRTVIKDGVEKKDHFTSVYQSPALFHKQEQFVPAAPPATEPPAGPTTTPAPTPAPEPTPTVPAAENN